MNTEADYATAYQAAYDALSAIRRPKLREWMAESVAACVIGEGGWGAERWTALSVDTPQRRIVLHAVMRDLPESAIVSSGPVDAAITAAAVSLLKVAK